jgi:PAS domain-containing protein
MNPEISTPGPEPTVACDPVNTTAADVLAESEERYRKVAEFSPLAIYIFQDGSVKYCNPAFLSLSGYTREEISTIDYI